MVNTMPRPSLTVYRASAGSGKTFTLAVEYIKLLVRNPQAYRQILAVTFTNKATEEMKMRILSQLYGIWRQLPESQTYATKVQQALGATPDVVSRQAGIALHNLLHNYSYFRVETIDSFFQSVLRNLARELELTANLRIGLNDEQVEQQAVDQLIDNLSTTDLMLQWVLRYIMDSISDDQSWNVIAQIKQFGRTIFRDYYKQQSRRLHEVIGQKGFFDSYQDMLRRERAKAQKGLTALADEFFALLDRHGLNVSDLSHGAGGGASFFVKLQQGTFDTSIIGKRVRECLDDPTKWFTKRATNTEAANDLTAHLRHSMDVHRRLWRLYGSADLTLSHLSQLRLLSNIEDKVRQLNVDANRFLLSDTQQLLHDLIDGSDSPFIFEKIGTQLEHIMIDEFQDTSTTQWSNFKVLLEEAMSHQGSESLIVGDVKQSIYRWRSGDWRLLANISQQFENADERITIHPLATNFRSARRIIDFNNAFFQEAARLEQVTAYDDVCQLIPENRPDEGYVEVTLLPAADYRQATLDALATQIRQLLSEGTPPTDITIIVRVNKHIPPIANYLMEQLPDITVVSDEAFRLDASPAVSTIIQAINYLNTQHPTPNAKNAALPGAYLRKVYSGRLDGPLPPDFTADLLRLPLYELVERLYDIFQLQRMDGQSAYLCAFYDYVAAYINDHSTDIASFLREWDETLCAKTIQSPQVNGVRIISIHKSKGLEIPCVLIPFCDWTLEHRDTIWCQPAEAPYDELPLAPIDFSQKGMMGTIYERDYAEEHTQTIVDNLNLLYVAFTRAERKLYVYGRRGTSSSRSAVIEQALPMVAKALPEAILSLPPVKDRTQPLHFVYGTTQQKEAVSQQEETVSQQEETVSQLEEAASLQEVTNSNSQSTILNSQSSILNSPNSQSTILNSQPSILNPPPPNPFLAPAEPLEVAITPLPLKVDFRQSNQSSRFASPDADDEQARQDNYIQLGTVLHEVFSTIRTTADIETALSRLELDGILYDSRLTRERIEKLIRIRLADPRVADFFSPRWTLFNECAIIDIDPETGQLRERRPDRVMTDGKQTIVVDFKFGHECDDYYKQVRNYMELLARMGHTNLRGFLWFVYANRLVEVQSEELH